MVQKVKNDQKLKSMGGGGGSLVAMARHKSCVHWRAKRQTTRA